MSSELEHHDIFKEILVTLYESIQQHPDKNDESWDSIKSMQIAFADLLAHIALLKTIPSPCFDTKYNIEFMGKTLVLEE